MMKWNAFVQIGLTLLLVACSAAQSTPGVTVTPGTPTPARIGLVKVTTAPTAQEMVPEPTLEMTSTEARTFQIQGHLRIGGGLGVPRKGGKRLWCQGAIHPNTHIVVKSHSDQLIGRAKAGSATMSPEGDCAFPFALKNVPRAQVYKFYLQPGPPGALETLYFSDMQAQDWKVVVTEPRK